MVYRIQAKFENVSGRGITFSGETIDPIAAATVYASLGMRKEFSNVELYCDGKKIDITELHEFYFQDKIATTLLEALLEKDESI